MEDQVATQLRRINRTLRLLSICAGLLLLTWLLKDILLLVFASVLLACALTGASGFLARHARIPRGAALLAVIVGLLLLFGALAWYSGPQVVEQSHEIVSHLGEQVKALWHAVQERSWGTVLTERIAEDVQSMRMGLTGYLSYAAGSTLGVAGSLLVVVATAVFFAISPDTYVAGAVKLVDPEYRWRCRGLAGEIGATLRLWFLGQLADMLVVTLLIGAGLFLLGVKLALTLSLFAGLMNFVPYIGALSGAVPAVLVAFSQSPSLAGWVALLFAVVQALEGYLIAPLVQRRAIDLPPALTILSQTVLGTLFGVLGIVLATPLMAAMLIAARGIIVDEQPPAAAGEVEPGRQRGAGN